MFHSLVANRSVKSDYINNFNPFLNILTMSLFHVFIDLIFSFNLLFKQNIDFSQLIRPEKYRGLQI